jgi:hypothetical protein
MSLCAGADRLSGVLDCVAEAKIAERWRLFGPECDERRRRLWAASEARTHGSGGVALVARVTGLAEETVRRGWASLRAGSGLSAGGRGELVAGVGRWWSLILGCSGIWTR